MTILKSSLGRIQMKREAGKLLFEEYNNCCNLLSLRRIVHGSGRENGDP